MLLLECPNCGPRNVAEFRYGGEVNPRPQDPARVPDDEWAAFLYLRNNVSGLHSEWWYHRAGCGLWFLADRDTATNRVSRTYLWQPPASGPAGPQASTPPQAPSPVVEG
jgi:heterotetrameric sarcosine oxidase delta subunit